MKKLKRLINSCYYWVRHRTIDKYHVIDTGLPPGYYEKDCQMLHGMFNLLVDHVDCEVAWMELIWKDLPWYMTKKRYIKKHGEMLGMEYLEWAKALKDDEVVDLAREGHSLMLVVGNILGEQGLIKKFPIIDW